jgi:sugar/nucleoside kinase (ribokinase family)
MAARRDEDPVDVLVVGDLLIDVIVRPDGPRTAGSDTVARIEHRRGGQGANQAAWFAAEGTRVGLAARIGIADLEVVAWELRAVGIAPFLERDADRATGTIVVLVDPATGERDMFSDRGAAAALAPADLGPGLAAARRWVHVSGYAIFGEHGPDVAATATAEARRRELGLSVDPASCSELVRFGVERFLDTVRGVDVLLPNADEALLLTGCRSPADAATALLDVAPTVAVTCGPNGALVACRGGPLLEGAARPATVVDTTGAGDAFTAGFLAGVVDGADAGACLGRGLRAAERAVAQVGGRPEWLSSSSTPPDPGGRKRVPRRGG